MKLIVIIAALVSCSVSANQVNHMDTGVITEAPQTKVRFLNTKQTPTTYPFSEGVQVGNTVYLSGQIGIDPTTSKLAVGGVSAETEMTLANISSSLSRMGYGLQDVVKCTVMLTNIEDFPVFNNIYRTFFSAPYPARSTMAVKALALGASIEIECLAAK
ncbi:RidA family protein [Shewanella donghaensis]|uniref:RidA family protein n=1 Tax=Shewanella donghaensis TaxID=238836 RepID=UPI001D04EB53|nr:Rid family detoxifying hydrolase [Shewanella donghaensis]